MRLKGFLVESFVEFLFRLRVSKEVSTAGDLSVDEVSFSFIIYLLIQRSFSCRRREFAS